MPTSPTSAVLAGEVERVSTLLDWLSIPMEAGAPPMPAPDVGVAETPSGAIEWRIAAVHERAALALGSEEKARRWLTRPNRALGEAIPLCLLESDNGVDAVLRVLDRIEHGGVS